MSLIKCPECNKDLSTQATSCPHCGYSLNRIQDRTVTSSKRFKALLATVTAFIFAVIIGVFTGIVMGSPTEGNGQVMNDSADTNGNAVSLATVSTAEPNSSSNTTATPKDESPTNLLQPNPPESLELTTNEDVFASWSDLKGFKDALSKNLNAQWPEFLKDNFGITNLNAQMDVFAKARPNGLTDADNQALGEQNLRGLRSLESKFKSEGRILKVPAGTKIRITGFYNGNGKEATPVWNDPMKSFFTADGNELNPLGEWEGKSVVIGGWDGKINTGP